MTRLRKNLLSLLPKALLSKTTGCLTSIPVPRTLRHPLYSWFCNRYGVVRADMEHELSDYRSFSDFFARSLRPGARPLADSDLVSPVDGKVVCAGPIRAGRILQVKDRDYSLDELLAGLPGSRGLFDEGQQLTIYLAPGDYHRIHSPCSGRQVSWSYMPGTFFPVNPPAVRSIPDLFIRNERLCTLLEGTPWGKIALIPVAALNVGHIAWKALPDLHTNGGRPADHGTFEPPRAFAKGEELGRFGFGSTVILLFEKDRVDLTHLASESKLDMGEDLIARRVTT